MQQLLENFFSSSPTTFLHTLEEFDPEINFFFFFVFILLLSWMFSSIVLMDTALS
ncbi:hypothetical protein HanXRQr2_Chr07g0287361 [Helianthus annuus]|uniref:Uncharacterized protein n=1 Tax=Helianthus annuus TaxID=4232 RepID=A0A9K3IJN0_HELAN|nr:hypothetical protein HanXRQr2_Chr07g0287361 [Helianthus annuus]KAJ0904119.1 hypothetical protein HanPSC8_Chr07g0278181 [Helianthus annuus]